ncbi:uncharacterized protein LOC107850830 isoform X2 [Capsicum annuum]|uniref:uncharacterized protein LOC107850830 isoform X2 n=1 Tax=Capsicum annuum TaxID=4072 RepID=UPI0007BF6E70|nr:uncharacterized protein LOC107850830 isoform X2 [Capsicum annuum]
MLWYSVVKITLFPICEVRQSDFGDQTRIKMYFPRKGSQFTPSHHSVDFYWKIIALWFSEVYYLSCYKLVRVEEKMLAHLCLRFRTDSVGLQQQETLQTLPKVIL